MGIIYCVTNLINDKKYIGQSTRNLKVRKNEHLYNKTRYKWPFYNALNKYGEENFTWRILEDNINKQSHLNLLEGFWILTLKTKAPNGYNLKDGGSNGKHHESTKEKIRKNHNKSSGINHHFYGEKHTEATKKKMSEVAKKRSSKDNPMYGKRHSIESIRKNRETSQGKTFPGATFRRANNPEKKCWVCQISYRGKKKSIGIYEDPITASTIYNLIAEELNAIEG